MSDDKSIRWYAVTVDDAIDLVTDELGIGSERDTDLLDLVRYAIHARVENPNASFDDIVNANLDRSPDEVRGDWDSWS